MEQAFPHGTVDKGWLSDDGDRPAEGLSFFRIDDPIIGTCRKRIAFIRPVPRSPVPHRLVYQLPVAGEDPYSGAGVYAQWGHIPESVDRTGRCESTRNDQLFQYHDIHISTGLASGISGGRQLIGDVVEWRYFRFFEMIIVHGHKGLPEIGEPQPCCTTFE